MLSIKMLHDLPADGLSRFKFAHEKMIEIPEDFLTAHPVPTVRAACLQESLEPGCERTAKKTGCHRFNFFRATAAPLPGAS